MKTTGDGRWAMGDGERLSCEQFADRLADFLEREVDEPTRVAVETHALRCEECGPLLADLRTLRIDAANLPELVPSRDLWSGIAARIETPVIELPTTDDGRRTTDDRRTTKFGRRAWMGLAAAGLVAITAGTTYVITRQVFANNATRNVAGAPVLSPETSTVAAMAPTPDATRPQPGSSKPPEASVVPVSRSGGAGVVSTAENRPSSVVRRPSSPLELEIARLKAIVSRRRGQLDPGTLDVVDRNLKVIDDAIAQVKQALQRDPESRFLIESLNDALENKVEVLRTAALLPSRT
jgi:hypothetical protein